VSGDLDAGSADTLIVGGGSAGCVLANRLSAAGASVVLLEAGIDTPPWNVPEDIVDLYPRSYFNRAYMWPGLEAEQSAGNDGRATPFPQARVLGGGSSVMGMVAVRGVPSDYDGWQASGADGWAWPDVLGYFRRLESDWDFAGELHGTCGPVPIRRHRIEDWPPFCAAVGDAAQSLGWGLIDDMNAAFGDGYGRLPMSSRLSGRVSTAAAYLDRETRRRPNLKIVCETTVERLLFNGSRCIGAAAVTRGLRRTYRAESVIVSTGAIHSPTLLLRSGVGPEAGLRDLGIPVRAPRAGVGSNLQNHPVVYLATHVKPEGRPSPMMRAQFSAGLRYSSGLDPELSSDMFMLVVNKSSWHGLGESVAGLGVSLLRPFSRGEVKVVSADPRVPPQICFRFLSDERDRSRMIEGLGLAVALMTHDAVKSVRHELFAAGYSRVVRRLNEPGVGNATVAKLLAAMLDGSARLRRFMIAYGIAGGDVDETNMTGRRWLEKTVHRRTFGTYHPAGTCKMGSPDDETAVVDAHCRVIGTEGLRVVDASIMPTIVRGNTNVPVIMVAERAADLLLTDSRAAQVQAAGG
jgi:5-(hydroxymethyl)furfural/furfural oxidase